MEGKVGVDLSGKYGVLFDEALLRASMAGEYSPAMHVHAGSHVYPNTMIVG